MQKKNFSRPFVCSFFNNSHGRIVILSIFLTRKSRWVFLHSTYKMLIMMNLLVPINDYFLKEKSIIKDSQN